MRTLYIDVYFLINFVVDILSLTFAGLLSKINISFKNIFASAVVGAASASLIVFLPDIAIIKMFSSFLALLIMVLIVTIKIGTKRKMKYALSFCIFESFVGGSVTMLWGFLDTYLYAHLVNDESGGYVNRKLLFFAIIILLSIGVFKMFICVFSSHSTETTVCLEIKFLDSALKTEALVDTGNLAIDPMNMYPVLFLKAETAQKIFSDDILKLNDPDKLNRDIRKRIRLIPVTRMGETHVLMGIRPDSVTVLKDGEAEPVNVTVAIDKEGGNYGGYECLMPAAALDNVFN